MRVLILGGTRFVGYAAAAAALGEGWGVTTFNRGLSGADVAGVKAIRGDRTLPDDLARLAAAGPWDGVIDTSGYVPREVLAAGMSSASRYSLATSKLVTSGGSCGTGSTSC